MEPVGRTGTTILSLLRKDSILVVSDGRGSVKFKNEYSVVTDDVDKSHIIQNRFVDTISGSEEFGKALLDTIDKHLGKDHTMAEAIEHAQEVHIKGWKSSSENLDKTRRFPATVGINGFENEKPYIQLIGGRNRLLHVEEEEPFEIVCSGSGGKIARNHFMKLVDNYLFDTKYTNPTNMFQTEEEAINALQESVVVACINDPCSGGFFATAIVRRGYEALKYGERRHLFYFIAKHYVELEIYFAATGLFVIENVELRNIDQVELKNKIMNKTKRITQMKILGFTTWKTICLIQFRSTKARKGAKEVKLRDYLANLKIPVIKTKNQARMSRIKQQLSDYNGWYECPTRKLFYELSNELER